MEYCVYIFFATMLVLATIYAGFFIQETKASAWTKWTKSSASSAKDKPMPQKR